MKTLNIGKSGLSAPYVGMGTWAIGGGKWWGDNDDALSIRTIHEAIDRGIIWIDTAPVYGVGHSEEVVGKALAGRRDKVLLSTKCGLQWNHQTPCYHKIIEDKDIYRDLSGKSIRADVEDSLRRLQTDYIDILYTHWQSPDLTIYPLEETVETLMALKKEGKIRAIGASNVTPEHIEGYCLYGQLDVIQEKYSILDQHILSDLVPACDKYDVSIQAYSPLEQGLLTGKVTMDTILTSTDVRNNNRFWKPESRKNVLDMLSSWAFLTEKYSCSLANLVIAFTAATIPGLHVLCGARRPDQISDNANALNIELSAGDIALMKEGLETLK